MADGKPGRGSDQFPLRLPDGMRDRIKAAADAAGRSMNAEIVATLEEKYPSAKADIGLEALGWIAEALTALAQTGDPERLRFELVKANAHIAGAGVADLQFVAEGEDGKQRVVLAEVKSRAHGMTDNEARAVELRSQLERAIRARQK